MKKKGIFGFLALMMLLLALSGTVSAKTPVAANGRLKVKGTKIVNAQGKTFQIKGVSTHGLSWFPQYASKAAFKDLRDNWGVNTIRLAMYTAEYNGYCTGGAANQTTLKNKVKECVKAAKDLGMYVIIDWHILSDGNPNTYKSQANSFFKWAASSFKGYNNVLYEICNEPNGGTSWSQIKTYANKIINTIRKYDKNAIIIVGTPNWSQDVDVAAKSKLKGTNIVYALHFYANTHRDSYRAKAEAAIKAGLPILVSEFSICDASGNGGLNESEGNKWITFLNKYNVGYVAWSLCNKAETASLIKSSCSKTSGWTASDLSSTGKWLVKTYKGKLAASVKTTTANKTTANKTTTNTTTANKTTTNQNTGNTSSGTSAKTVKASKSNCKISVHLDTSWQSGNRTYAQFTVTLKNKSKYNLKSWKVRVNFSHAIKNQSYWNGTVKFASKAIQGTPASWNKIIPPKGSVSFTVQVSSASPKIHATSAVLK